MARKYQYVTVIKAERRRDTRNWTAIIFSPEKKKKKQAVYLNIKALCHAGSVLMLLDRIWPAQYQRGCVFNYLKGIKHMRSPGSNTETVPSIPGWTGQNSFTLYSCWDQGFSDWAGTQKRVMRRLKYIPNLRLTILLSCCNFILLVPPRSKQCKACWIIHCRLVD